MCAAFGVAEFTESFLPGSQVMLVLLSAAVACAIYAGMLFGSFAAVLLALGHIFLFQTPKREFSWSSQADLFELLFFILSAIFVARISSSLREAYQEAEDARLEAEDSIRAREDLIAIVSHDLKNPLSAIKINAQLLTRNPKTQDEASLQKPIATIEQAATRALALISDLLDFEKIRAGKFVVDTQPRSVHLLIAEIHELMMPMISNRSQQLILEEPKTDIMASFDHERLLQVLSNLVGNASKFTTEGGKIEVGWKASEKEIHLFVRDTGPGIPNDQLTHLFERYWQARKTARHGTGLGLSIAKGIVEAHGGQIWVESKIGLGSTFWFSVPIEEELQNSSEKKST